MRYSTRVLRLIDVLAMVLAGTGVLCLMLAAFTIIIAGGLGPNRHGQDPRLWVVCYAVLGITCTCLGGALNLQLIRVRANGGREPGPGSCGSLLERRATRGGDAVKPKPVANGGHEAPCPEGLD